MGPEGCASGHAGEFTYMITASLMISIHYQDTDSDVEDLAVFLNQLSLLFLLHSAQSCLTLCDRMDCSLPGSSVHSIL